MAELRCGVGLVMLCTEELACLEEACLDFCRGGSSSMSEEEDEDEDSDSSCLWLFRCFLCAFLGESGATWKTQHLLKSRPHGITTQQTKQQR